MTFNNPLRIVRLLVIMACGQLANSVSAATFHTIPLAWDSVSDAGIITYKVYVGTASQQYTQVFDAGLDVKLSIPDREFGKTYYLAVTAVRSTGEESPFSDEISVSVAPPPLPLGGGLSINAAGLPEMGWTFPASGLSSSPEFIIQASANLVDWITVDKVLPSQSNGGDGVMVRFSRALPKLGPKRFYRLTAENWMGASTGP